MGILSSFAKGAASFLGNPYVQLGAEVIGSNMARSANSRAVRLQNAADEEARRLEEAAIRQAQARQVQASQQPVALGPAAEQQVADARQTALRGIRASGLSGSGRATSAIIRDVESRVAAPLVEKERTRKERLATNLGNLDISAGAGSAGVARRSGANDAAKTVANAGLRSDVIGSVLGTIAAEKKERESRRN